MTYRATLIGHLLAVRWEKLELAEMESILARAIEVRRRLKRDLIYVTVRDHSSELPSQAVRQKSTEMAVELSAHVSKMYVVVSMDGTLASATRGMFTGMKTSGRKLAPEQAHKVEIVKDLGRVVETHAAELGLTPSVLMSRLSDAGIDVSSAQKSAPT